MINSCTVEHYRSISSANVFFRDINILAGKNASGKSNFVDSLRIVREFAEYGIDHALGERHGIDSVKQWSPSKPYHVKLRQTFSSEKGEGSYEVVISSNNKEYTIIEESGHWNSNRELPNSPIYRNFRFARRKNENRVDIYLTHPADQDADFHKSYFQNLEDELFIYNKRTTPIPELSIVDDYWATINSFEAYTISAITNTNPRVRL